MASCDQDIFEVLDSVDDKDLPTQFMSNAAPILEHAKDEVTDYLQTKSTDVLKKVRELVFSELVAKLPDLAGRELYARKNRDLLTNDIQARRLGGFCGFGRTPPTETIEFHLAWLKQGSKVCKDNKPYVAICLK